MKHPLRAVVLFLAAASLTHAEEVLFDFSRDDLGRWAPRPPESVRLEPAEGGAMLHLPQYNEGDAERWPAIRLDGQWDWSDYSEVLVEVSNPMDRTIMVQLHVAGGGSPVGVYALLPAGGRGVVTCDLTLSTGLDVSNVRQVAIFHTAPAFDWQALVHRVVVRKTPPEGHHTRRTQIRQALDQGLEALDTTRATLEQRDDDEKRQRGLQRLEELQNEADVLQGAFADWENSVRGNMLDFTWKIHRFTAQAQALNVSMTADLVLWTSTPWQHFEPTTMPAGEITPLTELSVALAGGEHEDRVINISNASGRALTFMVRHKADSPLREAVEFFVPQAVRAKDRTQPMDALVPADAIRRIVVPDGETRQLWIRVNTQHHELPPGSYELPLEFFPLENTDLAQEVVLKIERWPFDLPAKSPLEMISWAEMFTGRSIRVIGNRQQEAYDILVDGGATVFMLMPNEWPKPKFTPEGELAEPLDFTLHDERINFYRQRIPARILIYGTHDLGLWHDFEYGSPVWRRALAAWMGAWREHLDELGFKPGEFAFYLVDEPNMERIRTIYLEYGALLKEIWPEAYIYFNGSWYLFDDNERKQLFEIAEIVQPDRRVALESPNQRDLWLEALRTEVKEPWFYMCAGGRTKMVNLYNYYLMPAWMAVNWQLQGIGFWSFCAGHGEEPWDGLSERAMGLVVVYEGADRLIVSRRWAAYREGIEGAKLAALVRARGEAGERLVAEAAAEIVNNPDDPGVLEAWRTRLAQFVIENPL